MYEKKPKNRSQGSTTRIQHSRSPTILPQLRANPQRAVQSMSPEPQSPDTVSSTSTTTYHNQVLQELVSL
ncbi:hypothetical protein D9756_010497 [Leucocoprinus leucothites]|uniref:Uncharacterized protein n=1 Tax=Leucocoprinus leucothites TaxID=201217 RepID=A0A8H5CVH7_9AGAR|nr:hypothetical protein D9756_010497 [Leucoagaricus leucothites]